jgi:redox-sensing transcriptional repressor
MSWTESAIEGLFVVVTSAERSGFTQHRQSSCQNVVRSSFLHGHDGRVPEVVVERLPQYVRVLIAFRVECVDVVSSQQLGLRLRVTPAQIRKDLSYFGRFGKQGRGYNVQRLLDELRRILGLTRDWNVALVGVGRLGRAVLSYPGFLSEGFQVVAAFDNNPNVVGETIGGLSVRPLSELRRTITDRIISIGVVTVPGRYAQEVIDQLVSCGVKAILNYAPISPQVQPEVKVRNIDPVISLQSMTYHLMGS